MKLTLSIFTVMILGFGSGIVGAADPMAAKEAKPTLGEHAGQYIDDATVTASVEKKLMGDKLLNLGRISVGTDRGVVTLRGMVSSEEEKSRAEDLTRQVAGVTRVENILSIRSIKMQ
jgi:hyperosmotically inducible protein